jgi:hypothetical protein
MPKKDKLQEEVSKMKNLQIKTSIEKDATLNFPMWYDNRTKKAFLMHVMVVLDAIKNKKHGLFKDYKDAQKAYVEQKEAVKSAYKDAQKAYVEQKEAVKSAKAGLPLLDGTEQLRKLGRLKSYYLDQFNQMESSYTASERV